MRLHPVTPDPGDFIIPCDVNFDGQVDTADYLLLTRFVLGAGTPPTAPQINAGVLNRSGQLDTGDLVLHLNLVL